MQTNGLAERPYEHIGNDPRFFAGTRASRSDNTERVGLVDNEGGIEAVTQAAKFREGRHVTVHAEVRFGHDEAPPRRLGCCKRTLHGAKIQMRSHRHAGSTESATIDDRGVVEGIGHDDVVARRKCREGPDVGRVAGRKDECIFETDPIGQSALEHRVSLVLAADEARRAGPTRVGTD